MPHRRRFDLVRFLPFRLARLSAAVEAAFGPLIARFGLDGTEWRLVACLAAREPQTAQAIARTTLVHKTVISRATARLIELGLVERATADADRRALPMRLTDRGRQLHEEIAAALLDAERGLVDDLDPEESRLLDRMLTRLERRLSIEES